MSGWERPLVLVATVVLLAVLAGPPPALMDCVEFETPPHFPGTDIFRVALPRGLELRVGYEIEVRPAGEPSENYLWLVSPPLQTAPQRMIGEAYNVTAEQSIAMMPRQLNFVVTRADYQKMWNVYLGNVPAEEYINAMRRLRLGTLYLMVTEASVRGLDVEWLSFRGEACVPRQGSEPAEDIE